MIIVKSPREITLMKEAGLISGSTVSKTLATTLPASFMSAISLDDLTIIIN